MKTKNLFYFLILGIICMSLPACGDDDDGIDWEWRNENESLINKIANDPAYKKIERENGPEAVYYKTLREGTGTKTPQSTDQVVVYYKFSLTTGVVQDRTDVRVTLSLNTTVRGFSLAMQQMKVGEKGEFYIPWQSGYGAAYNTATGIPAYSTLIYEVELLEIISE